MRFKSFKEILLYYSNSSPNSTAILYDDGDGLKKGITYRQLLHEVENKKEEYIKSGKTSLGVLCIPTLECIINIFAANMAGLQITMLNPSDSMAILSNQISYTDTSQLWGETAVSSKLCESLTNGPPSTSDKLLFFTSGTTEYAKAVVLTGESLCQSAYNGGYMLPLKESDILLCILPLYHVFGFVCSLLWGLSSGATVALSRGMRHFLDDWNFYKPTAVSVVPNMLSFILNHNVINKELNLILVGAGGCDKDLLKSTKKLGIRVSFGYGLTETSSGVAISIGEDPFAMSICPDNKITLTKEHEVLISAPTCIMKGYYKHDNDTKKCLINGILHTGDLGFYDKDGKIHITGRKDDVLALNDGTKIYLPEYENEVAHIINNSESAVLLKNGKLVLVACGCGNELATIKMLAIAMANRPMSQHISKVIFTPDHLPRTSTGKLKRWELQQKVVNL